MNLHAFSDDEIRLIFVNNIDFCEGFLLLLNRHEYNRCAQIFVVSGHLKLPERKHIAEIQPKVEGTRKFGLVDVFEV